MGINDIPKFERINRDLRNNVYELAGKGDQKKKVCSFVYIKEQFNGYCNRFVFIQKPLYPDQKASHGYRR